MSALQWNFVPQTIILLMSWTLHLADRYDEQLKIMQPNQSRYAYSFSRSD
jgi:hypothetical protein